MFGHFKIQGHSGTSQKHRKGFQKRIENQKKSILSKKVARNSHKKTQSKIFSNKETPFLKFIKILVSIITVVLFFFIILKINDLINNYVADLENKKEEISLGKEAFYISLQEAEELINNHEYNNAALVIKEGMSRYDKYINANERYISRALPLSKSKKILNEIIVKSCEKNPETCKETIDIIRNLETQIELEIY